MGQLGSWVIRSQLESPVSTSDPSVPRSPCLKALGDILWKKDVVALYISAPKAGFQLAFPWAASPRPFLQVTKSV